MSVCVGLDSEFACHLSLLSLLALLVTQLEGETLRPVWGPMDKCYPVTTQVGQDRGTPLSLEWASWAGAVGGPAPPGVSHFCLPL